MSMPSAVVQGWSAWAPGHEERDAWLAWGAHPTPLEASGHPEARFLPAMLRRRCNPLTRIMLTTAFDCCAEIELARVRTVFASRHGSFNDSIPLLESIALGKGISPAGFSHTVHNAQAGLFSIAAENRLASTSLSAQRDTFGCGYVEALAHLEREPDLPVLLVVGDLPLLPRFASLVEEPALAYGLSLLLAVDGEGTPLGYEFRAEDRPLDRQEWPEALEFLRWLLSAERAVSLGAGHRWRKI